MTELVETTNQQKPENAVEKRKPKRRRTNPTLLNSIELFRAETSKITQSIDLIHQPMFFSVHSLANSSSTSYQIYNRLLQSFRNDLGTLTMVINKILIALERTLKNN